MNLVPTAIARGVARSGLIAQKNSPTILFGVGVVGMIGSTVLACRATLKLDETIAETKRDLMRVKSSERKRNGGVYSDNERRRDTAVVYSNGFGKVVRLYGPSILVGGAAIFCLTKSHTILNARNAALVSAYTVVDEAFKKYRSRVREKYGVEEDLQLLHDSEPVDILSESGNITHSTRVTGDPSMYARFFDQMSPEWSRDPGYNEVYLVGQQRRFNDLLIARGHVFLNEVYEALGLDHTDYGAIVGWILSPNGDTDNHIDFGLYADNERARAFINGRENSILLDFNVDGVIYDKIDNPKKMTKWQS
jgi:uncharacterized protein DUF6353